MMNTRQQAPSSAPPTDEGFAFRSMSGPSLATPYSSSVEGASTDFNSSRATSYDSPEQSWGMEYGYQSQHPGDHDWSPAMSHQTLPLRHPGSTPQDGKRSTGHPATRSRTVANAGSSPSSRKTASSPNASKVRKAKSAKPGKLSTISLDAPLSVLTKDSKIPLKDMESFVHRSTEERMKEKEKKNGYIVRPMNAFMLYRSAYADRAKNLFEQNNHQIVSKATGMSWKMETKEVHEHYKMLSEVERENHQKAWPDYKFSPSKTNTAARKRKGGEGSEDEGTEQDPTDYDWTPSGSRKPQGHRAANVRYGPEKAFEGHYPGHAGYPPHLGRIEYAYPHAPGRPMPMPMDGFSGVEVAYYPEHPHIYPHAAIEDPRFGIISHPYAGRVVQAPSGFPGMNHDDLFDLEYIPEHSYAHQVDPKLEEFSQVHNNGMFTEDGFADYHGEMLQHAQRPETGSGRLEDKTDSSILDMLSTDPEGFQKWVHNENQS